MTKRTKEILDKLDEVYTREYKCYLNHENPGQLLIATMLSAQCTDARVDILQINPLSQYSLWQYCDKGFICKISRYAGFCQGRFKRIGAGY